jgi:dephospho-CoA kinase
MLIVGLTGGIASGKSTITEALEREPGIAVVRADQLAWETYRPGTEVYHKLTQRFGTQIIGDDGTIDRKALGAILFRDPQARQFVNGLVHPAVIARLVELAEGHRRRGTNILVVEAALLLESPHVDRDFVDYYIVVAVDPEEQLRRLMARDGISPEEALRRVRAQTPQEEKIARADFVIESSGNDSETIARAKELFTHLQEEAQRRNDP